MIWRVRLVLIRHGQSGNNLLWEHSGSEVGRHPDTPLTARGHEQASRLAVAIRAGVLPWRIDVLYTSLMTRAVQTAAPLAEALDLPLHTLDIFESGGLFEEDPDTGERTAYPGANRSGLLALSPRLDLADDIGEHGWWRRDVERDDEHLARAQRVLREVTTRHPDDAVIALVTHGHFTQYLVRVFLGIEAIRGWIAIDNTAVTLMETRTDYPDSPLAVRINWTPHLSEDERTT